MITYTFEKILKLVITTNATADKMATLFTKPIGYSRHENKIAKKKKHLT